MDARSNVGKSARMNAGLERAASGIDGAVSERPRPPRFGTADLRRLRARSARLTTAPDRTAAAGRGGRGHRAAAVAVVLLVAAAVFVPSPASAGPGATMVRTPSVMSFGNQQVSTTSYSQFVSVQNAGTQDHLVIGALSITGTNAAEFVRTIDTCSSTSLAPGSYCHVEIVFAPTSTGSKSATLQLPSNAPTSPDTVSLSGNGVPPGMSRTPSILSFGNQQVSTTSYTQFISIQNSGSGNGPLHIGAITIAGTNATDFVKTVDTCSAISLSPGSYCHVEVAFAPGAIGAKSATLQLPSNAPTSPDTVSLAGSGVHPGMARTPSILGFGNQQVGSTSYTQFVSVQNSGTGNGPLHIGDVAFAGANAGHFVKTVDTCSSTSLSPGSYCHVEVAFAPTATGSKSATLQLPSNAPTSPDTVSLSGTGVPAGLSRTPSVLAFGNQQVNSTSYSQFASVQNSGTGNGPLNISDVEITGAHPGDFVKTADTCSSTSLSPGSYCHVQVTFTPSATGSRTATMRFPSNAPTTPDAVSLSGTGVVPVAVGPSGLTFANRQLGSTSPAQTVTVTYNGDGTATFGAASIAGANAADFDVDSDTCSGTMLFSGDQCQVRVTFAPGAVGTRVAELTVTSDLGSTAVSLAGTGIDTLGPTSAWTTANNSVRVSTLHSVIGTSSDPSGVASALVRFTDLFGDVTTVAATLTECSAGSRSCTVTAAVPLLLPGVYTARISATDALGNSSTGPAITVLVI